MLYRVAMTRGPRAGECASLTPQSFVERDERRTLVVDAGLPGHWRAQFDLTAEGPDPVEMRLSLKVGDKVVTENWLFQYHPF